MRPTTPNYNLARQAGPSPPPTPTTAAASSFNLKGNRRHGMHFKPNLPDKSGTITPNGNGPNFFYTPSNRPEQISPRTSSPDSSIHASSSSGSPPASICSDDDDDLPILESPPRKHTKGKIVAEGNFTVEEIDESDYEEYDSDDEDVIRPSQYEDAESDKALSVKSISHNDLPARILSDFKNLQCDPSEDDREAWLETLRAAKRRKRRSSGSVQKRTISQSIGSDTDDEDIQPVTFDANDAGSSARRLRRKVKGERISLIFDDPPQIARIDEEEEGPESVEELVEMKPDETEDDEAMRELPYYRYIQQDMDVDTSDEE